ncbi:helix-turn-helix domain-containing GNAT family N-acetyltransferase [Paenibacillus melissococcoides]|uniref:Helix-turn-helix domain-containing GNAT family N-acetyltransferase n=1 Tax=Paenibacillus melissococcoides TaxID=2912268 RepID=A0ABN8U702_9BACL|nr:MULTISPECIES: helix-turn-helix domain-containing GNAT family N-acetyltransferase [Paenibacillus]MEB9892655.1 helix-turn-helix domain-containing GNAT family N-acetyltransferase [Bacillus cereus]CAH8246901.1 helix-turn-helix domain-containing GNAT family N-acetyltransferase [Paenibacillus melissococcoides]CAH8716146.1 helix-turn-helix domain-containing GNAT family N-acetyltransferase [Paenibacillus melissococcoides]CAH8717129.1 helix-turn-helix domain-containing GNAT family N-acetyltransferase
MTRKQEKFGTEFRTFNRFYTDVLGFLNEHIYDSPFSLTETRILYEIYTTPNCTAKYIQERLDLDGGYVSRIIKRFEKEKMIDKHKCKEDGRNHLLYVTDHGKLIYKELEKKANQQVGYILENLNLEEKQKLVSSMNRIQEILSDSAFVKKEKSVSIRSYYTSEDVKNIIEQQWTYYHKVCKWDEGFLKYLYETFDAEIERIWIAERNRQFAGCIGLVNSGPRVGQLRWFLVKPVFQKQGVGSQLIHSIVDYCKNHNYERIFLWTVRDMLNARFLYQKFGFEMTEEQEEKTLWGTRLVEERWDLELRR